VKQLILQSDSAVTPSYLQVGEANSFREGISSSFVTCCAAFVSSLYYYIIAFIRFAWVDRFRIHKVQIFRISLKKAF